MIILITGSDGFIGSNLAFTLPHYFPEAEFLFFNRNDDLSLLSAQLRDADILLHFAGCNRSQSESRFYEDNVSLVEFIVNNFLSSGSSKRILYASSQHVSTRPDTVYSTTKSSAESLFSHFSKSTDSQVSICRFPSVFGKWCKPNYNSVVATFCHNLVNDIPLRIDDPETPLELFYIDDLIDFVVNWLSAPVQSGFQIHSAFKTTSTTLNNLVDLLSAISSSRGSSTIPDFSDIFMQQLYATYISYLPAESFVHSFDKHIDSRGAFAQLVQQPGIGQVSVLTASPGITRGIHFHNTKVERFYVLAGTCVFRMRNIKTDQVVSHHLSFESSRFIETIPGWSHEITNIGDDTLVVFLWCNQIFDPSSPDTFFSPLS